MYLPNAVADSYQLDIMSIFAVYSPVRQGNGGMLIPEAVPPLRVTRMPAHATRLKTFNHISLLIAS